MDGNSKVLGCGNLLQDLSVHAVKCGVMLFRVRHGENITLSYVKVHAPLVAPTGQVTMCYLVFKIFTEKQHQAEPPRLQSADVQPMAGVIKLSLKM